MDNIQETAQQTTTSKPSELTITYVLARMEEITRDVAYVHEALAAVQAIPPMADAGAMGTRRRRHWRFRRS